MRLHAWHRWIHAALLHAGTGKTIPSAARRETAVPVAMQEKKSPFGDWQLLAADVFRSNIRSTFSRCHCAAIHAMLQLVVRCQSPANSAAALSAPGRASSITSVYLTPGVQRAK